MIARLKALLAALRGHPPVSLVATAELPTEHGDFVIHVFESRLDGATHVALVRGDLGDGQQVLARVHSSCVTGDIFHSSRCDCGQQLDMALGGWRPKGAAWCSTCTRRGAASASPTRSGPTRCRTAAATPSKPTSSSASRPICAITPPPCTCSSCWG
ncbi:MAG: hypothetical protein JNL48_15665 [Acidobacteria bacterium]|nr:hypothetical protein [Acidobacteriota bacterium]